MTERLKSRRIAITGAASGIGAATARLFAGEAAAVALLDRDERVRVIADDIGGAAIVCDVTDERSVVRAVDAASSALSGLDGLVNAAGIASTQKIADTELSHWEKVMAVNLTGPFLLCRAALPLLARARQGTIVNVASASALLPSGASAAYAASKAGLLMLTKAIAAEYGPSIRANAVCPGTVDTPMIDGLFARDAALDGKMKASYALQRMARPDEIARVILFLTSDESSIMTGASVAADGGRSYH